jgi:hypothetical protein
MHDARDVEPLWRSRLRWRWRGALLWPVFAVLTIADALLLGRLPIAGDGGTALVPALLLAAFFNLVVVAAVAPVVARRLRRRRRDLPKVVADDYAGAGLVVLVTALLLLGGLRHRSAVEDVEHDLVVQRAAAQDWFRRNAEGAFRRRIDVVSTVKMEDELFRTCVPGDDPKRWLCVFVSTDTAPPGLVEDESRESNASFARAGGFR